MAIHFQGAGGGGALVIILGELRSSLKVLGIWGALPKSKNAIKIKNHLGDNCIQNFHLADIYTVGNLVLQRRASVIQRNVT